MKTYKLYDYFSKDGWYCTQGYGANPSYYSKFNLLFHEGVDFGHKNKKIIVRCPFEEAKVIIDNDTPHGAYGSYVVLWDMKQECAIYFAHMENNNFVSHNQVIHKGDKVGEMGTTGNSTGEHTHINFVITKNGSRLYKTKNQNWGYLDPQHPLDTGNPVSLPSVPKYKVEWMKPDTSVSADNSMSTQTDLQACLTAHSKLVDELTQVKKEYSEYKTNIQANLEELQKDRDARVNELKQIKDEFASFKREIANILGTTQSVAQMLSEVELLIATVDDAKKKVASMTNEKVVWDKQRIEMEGEIAKLRQQLKSHKLEDQDFEVILKILIAKIKEWIKA